MYWTNCKTIIFYSIKYVYLSTTLKLIVDLHYLENYKNLSKFTDSARFLFRTTAGQHYFVRSFHFVKTSVSVTPEVPAKYNN